MNKIIAFFLVFHFGLMYNEQTSAKKLNRAEKRAQEK